MRRQHSHINARFTLTFVFGSCVAQEFLIARAGFTSEDDVEEEVKMASSLVNFQDIT